MYSIFNAVFHFFPLFLNFIFYMPVFRRLFPLNHTKTISPPLYQRIFCRGIYKEFKGKNPTDRTPPHEEQAYRTPHRPKNSHKNRKSTVFPQCFPLISSYRRFEKYTVT